MSGGLVAAFAACSDAPQEQPSPAPEDASAEAYADAQADTQADADASQDAPAETGGDTAQECTPKSCLQLGLECGPADDGCGAVLSCGDCKVPLVCGGGGVEGRCGEATESGVDGSTGGGTYLWSKRFGDWDSDECRDVVLDGSGAPVITGNFRWKADFGGGVLKSVGGDDGFVAAYGADGTYRWSKAFGGSGYDSGRAVAIDSSGNVTVVGDFDGTVDFGGGPLTSAGPIDFFVASFDSTGAHRWSKSFGGGDMDSAYDVAVDGNGNVTVTGMSSGPIDFGGGTLTGGGGDDIFVVSFDSAGAHRWSKLLGGPGGDAGYAIAADASGNVFVAGDFVDTVDLGGGAMKSADSIDTFLVSFDPMGAHRWSKSFGGTGWDFTNGVALDTDGNVTIAGLFQTQVDFGGGPLNGKDDVFIASFDPTGAHRWSRSFGAAGWDTAYGVGADVSGNVTITGSFEQTSDFGGGPLQNEGAYDVFMASFDSTGSYRRSERLGSTSYDRGAAVAVDALGETTLVGSFAGTVSVGADSLTSAGAGDGFVVRLGP